MAKTYKHIYPRIYDFAALYHGFELARRGKRYSSEVVRFARNLEENLIIQNELIWKEYKIGKYHEFFVYEPKRRKIAALPFCDRIVQHALVSAITPIWEKRFIFDTYACRVGKGTHIAADRAQGYIRKTARENEKVYIFKGDVKSYFASISHGKLKQLLRRRIADNDAIWLLEQIIDSASNPGIPIGNLTSQLFANIYLHELDKYVKHELKELMYLRYMDDFIIVSRNKERLKGSARKVQEFLGRELSLQLNGRTQLFPVAIKGGRGLDFLGYRMWVDRRLLRKRSVRKMRSKIKKCRTGLLHPEKLTESLISWTGHAGHADTVSLQKQIRSEAQSAICAYHAINGCG